MQRAIVDYFKSSEFVINMRNMEIIKRMDRSISKKEWDHLKFLQALTVTIAVVILLFYLWIFYLSTTDLIVHEYMQEIVKDLGVGLLTGGIAGLITGFFILLPKYIKKEWDLHIVIPYFLFMHVIILTLVVIISFFLPYSAIFKNGFVIGLTLGGFLTAIAYAGEIKIEHSNKSETDET